MLLNVLKWPIGIYEDKKENKVDKVNELTSLTSLTKLPTSNYQNRMHDQWRSVFHTFPYFPDFHKEHT